MKILVQFDTKATTDTFGAFMLEVLRSASVSHVSPRRGQAPAVYVHLIDGAPDAQFIADGYQRKYGAAIVMTKVSSAS